MKKILDFLKNLLIFIYVIVVIFVTICLLSYNDYKVTVLGTTSIIPITDDNLKPDYALGDLLLVKRNKLSDVRVGDKIFFYRTRTGETSIYFAEVTNTERVTDKEYTYTVEGDYRLSSSTYIGKTSTATVIPKVGRFLSFIESKWGFLFLVVFPTLIIFLYTLYSVVLEVRDGDKEEIEIKKEDKAENKEENVAKEKIEENKKEVKKKTVEEKQDEEKTSKEKEEVKENKEENKAKVEEKHEEKKEAIEIEKPKEENKEIKETTVEEKKIEENKIEQKEESEKSENELPKTEVKQEAKVQTKSEVTPKTEEQRKRELIEAKLKNMTEEEKKALLRAKLNSMTEEEKRALLEKKRKEKSGN